MQASRGLNQVSKHMLRDRKADSESTIHKLQALQAVYLILAANAPLRIDCTCRMLGMRPLGKAG